MTGCTGNVVFVDLARRVAGRPPLTERPVGGVTLDVAAMTCDYFTYTEWGCESVKPLRHPVQQSGLEDVIADFADGGCLS